MTAYEAQLRVYEPLAAFSGAELEHWRSYVAQGLAPMADRGPALERAAALRAMVGAAPAYLPDLPEHAYVASVDGITLVCPWRTRVRAWQALAEFRGPLPDAVAEAFLPHAVAVAAADDLDAWRAEHPELRTHVLESTWQVPVRWFVLVDADERLVRPGTPGARAGAPPGRRTGRSLVYRTPMSRARQRTARALSVMRRVLGEDGATAGVEELGRWLEEFHPRSLVELDYGGLVHLLDDGALAADESARDVATALAALAEGRGTDAGAAYARVTTRMHMLQSVESAS